MSRVEIEAILDKASSDPNVEFTAAALSGLDAAGYHIVKNEDDKVVKLFSFLA